MNKATIEIIIGNDGKLKYAVDKSGNKKIDKLVDVALGTMNLFVKSGGNPNSLLGVLGNGNQLNGLLGNLMGGMSNGIM